MQRRELVLGSFAALAATALPARGAAESPLIYISPMKSDGGLSRCQAEVWFALHGGDYYVVTAADAWRARAIERGLSAAQIWVGDVGQWRWANGRHRSLPRLRASGSMIDDPALVEVVLQRLGEKYADEWGTWGPRFRNGLASGQRVMLRYRHMEV